MLLYCMFTTFIMLGDALEDNRLVVETSLGTIRGHYKQSHDGKTFSAFEGIPYAKPPVGNLRFEAPQEVEPWSGTWNAVSLQECAQLTVFETTRSGWMGTEDCLYLNVYVPTEGRSENLDVIVSIHGGAFMFGGHKLTGPELLMDRHIVYVSMNFRVGALGYLYTEDDSVSGNNGLKDQILALKWIQNHIQNFRGNPNSVTITGLSSGAISVHLHYLSPLAKGLFHRGISNSGTSLAPWALQEAPLLMAKKLASHAGCPIASTKELATCLKQRPVDDILKFSWTLLFTSCIPMAPFAPVVEKEGEGAYLTDDPYQLLLQGKIHDVPWISSFTSAEGVCALVLLEFRVETLSEQWNTVLPLLLEYYATVDGKYQDAVSEKIKRFYFRDEMVSNDTIASLIKMHGDRMFYLNTEQATRMQAKVNRSPVYSYMFGYTGKYDTVKMRGLKENYGVNHADDGFYCYIMTHGNTVINNDKFTGNDERIKNLLLDIITSFAKNGKPLVKSVNWEPFEADSEGFNYLSINNDNIKMDVKKELAPTQFWHSLPIQEHQNINRQSKGEL